MKSSDISTSKWFLRLFINAVMLVCLVAIFACRGGGDGAGSSAVYPRFAYVANRSDDTVSIYTVDSSTGQLHAKGYVMAGDEPFFISVDPSGRFAYVTDADSDNISAYSIDATTGALTPIAGSPFAAGDGPFSVAVDPLGKFAYVANALSDNVSAYLLDPISGKPTTIAGSPFTTGGYPCSVSVDPSGKFAYVTNGGSNNCIEQITGRSRASV